MNVVTQAMSSLELNEAELPLRRAAMAMVDANIKVIKTF